MLLGWIDWQTLALLMGMVNIAKIIIQVNLSSRPRPFDNPHYSPIRILSNSADIDLRKIMRSYSFQVQL